MHTKLLSFSFLIICLLYNIPKSYAQREIHPLEQIFTYDYAIKYYGNLTLGDYWSLDNFKSPKGVKSIEQYDSFFHDSARSRAVHYYEWKKRTYSYNKVTGFLEGITTIDRYNKKVLAQTYKYKTDSLHLIINVEHFSFDEKSNKAVQQTVQQYIYDLKTENLIKTIYHKNTKSEQIIRYIYDENQKDLIDIKIGDNSAKQEISISYDTLKPIDKIKYSIRIGKKYKYRNDSIYLNKEETLVNLSRRRLSLKTFSTGYKTINNGKSNREYYENLSRTHINYIDFGSNYIYYYLGYPQYVSDYPRPIDRSVPFKFPQTGTFLFDKKGKLSFIKYHTDIIRENLFTNNRSSRYPWMPETERENSISIIEKKNDNKWIFISYNELQIKKKLFSRYNRFKVKRKQKAIYEIKNSSIYKDNNPIIIYNYYN